LVDRGERDTRIVRHDVFRAVAVMSVEIPNRDAFRPIFQGVERSYGDVAEVTKAHGAIARGVMARRSHQAEGALAAQRRPRHGHGSARCARGVLVNARDGGGVRVKIFRRIFYPLDMLRGVSAQEHFLRGSFRPPPLCRRMPGL
jgi:hypothetical protein